jgi:hypothetical protein
MDGLARAVGDGISGFVSNAIEAITGFLRALIATGQSLLPGGLFWVVLVGVLVIGAWLFLKR